jgi:hypothetical protein
MNAPTARNCLDDMHNKNSPDMTLLRFCHIYVFDGLEMPQALVVLTVFTEAGDLLRRKGLQLPRLTQVQSLYMRA